MASFDTKASPPPIYWQGQRLDVVIDGVSVPIRICHLIQPCTLSCGMVVEILSDWSRECIPRIAFLKLFDRRVTVGLREDKGIEPWTEEHDKAYLATPENEMFRFVYDLENIPNCVEDTGENWDDAENEAYLSLELKRLHDKERNVYQRLRAYQGRQIPRLYASVSVPTAQPPPKASPWQRDFLFTTRGLLMEYVDGFVMSDVKTAPPSAWQDIVDQAVRHVHILGDHEIANDDTQTRNFLVRHNGPQRYKVVMIDFGLCRFRHPALTDFQWGRLKQKLDEANGVGLLMQKRLRNNGITIHFQRSTRWDAFAETEAEMGMEDTWYRGTGGRDCKRELLRTMSM